MPQSHYHWNDREHDVTIGFELCMNIKNLATLQISWRLGGFVRVHDIPQGRHSSSFFVMVGLSNVRHTVGVEDVGMET